jgi:hypothetical protein
MGVYNWNPPDNAHRLDTAAVRQKSPSGIYKGVPLIHNSVYPICKEFLLLRPLYRSLLHIAVWRECTTFEDFL